MVRPWEICQAIYIHIPFCRHKCCYCDFTSYQGQSETVQERYTEALCREIRTCRPGLPVSPRATVYFGGGTPTCLSLSCLTRIVAALKDAGFWQQPAEATVEANPGTLSPDLQKKKRRIGFDRLSLGVQSLQADELQRMGRIHTAEEARQAFLEARDAGFRRISTDLIYGYPGQTAASVEDTLQRLLAWQPDHVSVYGLSVEPGTVLAARLDQGVWQLPDEEESGRMYDLVMDGLPAKGYARYEISNFARPGQESLHNEVYWRYEPYLAFGAGACRFDGKKRETAPRGLYAYMKGEPAEVEVLSPDIRREELVFMNLRTARGLDLAVYEERTGEPLSRRYGKALEKLAARKWLVLEDGRIHLTPLGMRYGNLAFEEFI